MNTLLHTSSRQLPSRACTIEFSPPPSRCALCLCSFVASLCSHSGHHYFIIIKLKSNVKKWSIQLDIYARRAHCVWEQDVLRWIGSVRCGHMQWTVMCVWAVCCAANAAIQSGPHGRVQCARGIAVIKCKCNTDGAQIGSTDWKAFYSTACSVSVSQSVHRRPLVSYYLWLLIIEWNNYRTAVAVHWACASILPLLLSHWCSLCQCK